MRLALCALVALLGFTSIGYAQNSDDKVSPRSRKQSETPTVDLNTDYMARFGANESQIWHLPDPTGTGLHLRQWGGDNRPPGLTISRPLD